jgi:hypothetical protein
LPTCRKGVCRTSCRPVTDHGITNDTLFARRTANSPALPALDETEAITSVAPEAAIG